MNIEFLTSIFLLALDPCLQHAVDLRKQVLPEAQSYTYTEHRTNINYDSKGKETHRFSDTYEIIFLEGAPYKKHILHDEKPLSEKEAKAEARKLEDVAKARREQRERHSLLHASFNLELPLDQLATSFEVKTAAPEELDGRQNLVFTAIPSAGPDAKTLAHNGLAYEMRFWVDQQDNVFRRVEAKVIADGMRWEKDSVVVFDFAKVRDEAWLPARFSFKGRVHYMGRGILDEAEQTYSGYKKFQADVVVH
jgi:hypothetical protein